MQQENVFFSTGGRRLSAVAASALLIVTAALSGCMRSGPPPQAPAAPEVGVALPKPGKVVNYEYFPGHIEAVNSINVEAMVPGRLEEVRFTDGQLVEKNQELFLIDPKVFQAQFEQAKANVAFARAHLAHLEADLRRDKALLPTKAISQQDYDLAEGLRNEAAASVDVAVAAMNSAEENLKYTTVRAKFAGRIGRRMIDPGNMVRANDTVLTTLVSADKMYIYFDVDERTTINIRDIIDTAQSPPGQSAVKIDYALATEEGYPRSATVHFFDNQINSGTATWRLRASIENPDQRLLANQFVRVRVPIGAPYDTLLVPERALGSDQGQKFLYVIDKNNKAVYKQVQCGPQVGEMLAILSGLDAKDRVVVNGLQRIHQAGEVVDPKEEKPAKEDAKKEKQMADRAAQPKVAKR
jgi:RND family efflux transporter MFP subunit